MGDAGFEATGAKCATDIHVETGSDIESAELSDRNLPIGSANHD